MRYREREVGVKRELKREDQEREIRKIKGRSRDQGKIRERGNRDTTDRHTKDREREETNTDRHKKDREREETTTDRHKKERIEECRFPLVGKAKAGLFRGGNANHTCFSLPSPFAPLLLFFLSFISIVFDYSSVCNCSYVSFLLPPSSLFHRQIPCRSS